MFDTGLCFKDFKKIEFAKDSIFNCNSSDHAKKIFSYLDGKLKKKMNVSFYGVFKNQTLNFDSLDNALSLGKTFESCLFAIGSSDIPSFSRLKTKLLKTCKKIIVASGQAQKNLSMKTKLWPQELYKKQEVILVGLVRKTPGAQKLYPKFQFYKNEIEIFEIYEANPLKLGGSSFAAAKYFLKEIK